jgi:enoyl-CoA hydratase
MSDIAIRREGRAGRITLTRPKALNALTYDMALAIEEALIAWAEDDSVALVVIDAEGDKAFCAGGDIAKLYETGRAGDFAYGQRFWRDEYRLNAMIAEYPKPYVAFMRGFTMGGGVGISCHGSTRVVGESSQISMPECGIGLVPDVGGSLLLARAPGRLGEYLGLTAARMGAADAIFAGFADAYVLEATWPEVIATLCETGDAGAVHSFVETPPEGRLTSLQAEIDALFGGETLTDILTRLNSADGDLAAQALKAMGRNSPLSMSCTVEMIRRLRDSGADIRTALDLEYRFTARAMEQGDFLEGIRAAVIDKDRAPNWQHGLEPPPQVAAMAMLEPLPSGALTIQREE